MSAELAILGTGSRAIALARHDKLQSNSSISALRAWPAPFPPAPAWRT